jgi:hypothetical protein
MMIIASILFGIGMVFLIAGLEAEACRYRR